MHEAVDAFADAQRRLDVDAALSFIAPGSYMYVNGQRADHDAVAAQIISSLPTLQRLDTTWSNIEVTMLGRDHSLVSLTFEDEITDADGATTRQWGPSSFVWRRLEDGWRLIYADADHCAVEDGGAPAGSRR